MVMSLVQQVWPKPSFKAQWTGEEDKADRGRGGNTTSGNGEAQRAVENRGKWGKLVAKSSVVTHDDDDDSITNEFGDFRLCQRVVSYLVFDINDLGLLLTESVGRDEWREG